MWDNFVRSGLTHCKVAGVRGKVRSPLSRVTKKIASPGRTKTFRNRVCWQKTTLSNRFPDKKPGFWPTVQDPEGKGLDGRIRDGHLLAIIDPLDYWQLGYVILKGSYQKLRADGIETLQSAIADLAPEFRDRVHHLKDWSQMAFLSVESNRLPQWYRPGLLLIGDAAHTMSPVGGVGINYAVQDAIVAANILSKPLKNGSLHLWDLAEVQRQREWPIKAIQAFQNQIQKQIIARALDGNRPFKLPGFLRLPILRDIPGQLIGFGIWPVNLKC